MGAAIERCSGSRLSSLRLDFTAVFEDFGHIFPPCSNKFTKMLKGGKIFRCVTSFYQHFFVSDKICCQRANSGNSYNYIKNSLRWLIVGLKLVQLEHQKRQLPLIILAKYLKPINKLCRVIKGTWNLWIGNKSFAHSNFSDKKDIISLKNSSLRELQVLTELIFRYNFQLSIFILQESSKRCFIFSYFSMVFEKWANLRAKSYCWITS